MLLEATVLSRALKSIIPLVPKRSTLPILEHVLLEPSGTGKLRLAVTDLATRAEVEIPATEPVATCLPARALLDFKTGARGAGIKIAIDGKRARLTAPGSTAELYALSPRDFPTAIAHAATSTTSIEAADLAAAVRWTLLAVGCDVTRPQLTGICLHGDRVVATDGHRLHFAVVAGLSCPKMLVPAAALELAARAWRCGTVEVSMGATSIEFRHDATTVTAKLIE